MKGVVAAIAGTGALVLGVAVIAWGVIPSTGGYQGIIDGSENVNGHNEGEGLMPERSAHQVF